MAETTTLRLMAAAKEFNIGKDTLVDFLVGKGFSKDDLKPTSKLTEDMYSSLQQEFNSDKVAKHKSDQIDLPKGSLEAKKKKEEEPQQQPVQPLFKKDVPPVIKKPAKEEAPPPVVEETPAPLVVEAVREEPEVVKIEAPELEGPKVVTKIDLSAIDSSTRPRKSVKKEEPVVESAPEEPAKEPAPQPEPVVAGPVAVEEAPVVAKEEPVTATEERAEAVQPAEGTETEQPDVPPVIENIRAEKIEGPKILGKIELPANSDTRPKPPSEEKLKQKPTPTEKKGDHGSQGGQQGGGRPGQRPGGGTQQSGPFGGQGSQRQPGHQRPPLQRNTGGRGPGGAGQGHGGHGQGGGNRRNDPRHAPREAKEIDKKEIQEKIRQTQAKLAGAGGRGKSL